jgi:hypothetical protein
MGLRKALVPAALLLLYLIGVVHWLWFFNRGDLSFSTHDWPKEHSYYTVLQEAMASGRVPYHFEPPRHGTDRFLGLPETNLSPQVLLLPWMDVGRFVLVNIVLLYSVGYVGCLLLRRRYHLSLVPFATVYLLFSFNGYITAHLAVGHSMWAGYFLLPFFSLYLLEWVEERASAVPALKLALVLFAMMLQGSFHLVIWCWVFLLFFLVFNPALWRGGLLVFGFSGWLSVFRLVPAAVTFGHDRQRGFWAGYPTLADMLDGFVRIRAIDFPAPESLGWWEFDTYVGVLGLAALLYFGVVLRVSGDPCLARYRYEALDAPLLILFFLSLSYFYTVVNYLRIPLLNAEIISSRFLIIPVLLLTVVAAIRMQVLLERTRRTAALHVLIVGGLLLAFSEMMTHSDVWKVTRIEASLAGESASTAAIIDRTDGVYTASVRVSAVASAVAVVVWLYVFFRARLAGNRRPKNQS